MADVRDSVLIVIGSAPMLDAVPRHESRRGPTFAVVHERGNLHAARFHRRAWGNRPALGMGYPDLDDRALLILRLDVHALRIAAQQAPFKLQRPLVEVLA